MTGTQSSNSLKEMLFNLLSEVNADVAINSGLLLFIAFQLFRIYKSIKLHLSKNKMREGKR